jgi:hypothetical protein
MSLIVPLVQAFDREKVSYVVVGGLAVVLHGHERLTGDVDIVVQLEPKNAGKAIDVLMAQGYGCRVPEDPKRFIDPATRARWISEKNMKVFSFFHKIHPVFGVDIFVEYPVDFEGLYGRSVLKSLGTVQVRVASLEDLIDMKKKVGRPKDLEDVRWLEGIRRAQQRT